jgi:hypothetical protein
MLRIGPEAASLIMYQLSSVIGRFSHVFTVIIFQYHRQVSVGVFMVKIAASESLKEVYGKDF